MAALTQTAQTGGAQIGQDPRSADDASDNKTTAGVYSHRSVDFSATEKAELVSRLLLIEQYDCLRLVAAGFK
jgi:hypothetical protein